MGEPSGSPAHAAAANGDLDGLKQCLSEEGVAAAATDESGRTIIMVLIQLKHWSAAEGALLS